MILHYFVSFKGHKCALVTNQGTMAGWLLRCHKGEEPFQLITPAQVLMDPEARRKQIAQAHGRISNLIAQTERARAELREAMVSEIPPQLVKRLLADQPDTRERARRWRIVPVHRGPKGKQP